MACPKCDLCGKEDSNLHRIRKNAKVCTPCAKLLTAKK